MYTRKVVCFKDSEAIELITQSTYDNENGTVFPSPKTSAKVKTNSGLNFRFSYKITL